MTYQDRTRDLSEYVRSGNPLGDYPTQVKGLRMTGYTQVLNGNSTLIQLIIRISDHIGSERWICDDIDYVHNWKHGGEFTETDIDDPLLRSLLRHLFFRAEAGLSAETNDIHITYKPCVKNETKTVA